MAAPNDLLKPLDDLAYLIECAALDYTGELKTELNHLCTAIASAAPGYDSCLVQAELTELNAALSSFLTRRKGEGVSKLIAISRRWWKLVRNERAP